MNIPLQTIADLAGVSRSTVSLALRNSSHLAPATRERAQKSRRKSAIARTR